MSIHFHVYVVDARNFVDPQSLLPVIEPKVGDCELWDYSVSPTEYFGWAVELSSLGLKIVWQEYCDIKIIDRICYQKWFDFYKRLFEPEVLWLFKNDIEK